MKSTYNTRRKSVSLTALGVQLPGGRSRASTSTEAKTETHSSSDARSHASHTHQASASSPPSKRVKRSHSPPSPARTAPSTRPGSRQRRTSSPTPQSESTAVEKTVAKKDAEPQSGKLRPKSRQLEFTPPPSPRDSAESKLDYAAIQDDIVEDVVTQLEKTGNRPHLIRELAAVLATTNDSVTSSANAPALLSSRLASFMKRTCWSASNPCPVAKELIPVHPRKVFYYLTDRARQQLPETSDDIYRPLGIRSPTGSTPPVSATPLSTGATAAAAMGPPAQPTLKRPFEPTLVKYQNESPPLSTASAASAAGDDDSTANADERRERWAPSPSPEIDLTYHEPDYPEDTSNKATTGAPSGLGQSTNNNNSANSGSGDLSSSRRASGLKHELEPPRQLHLNTRAQSPRVEGDEREFRDTVFSLRASPTKEPPTPVENKMEGVVKEQEEREPRRLAEYEIDTYSSTATHLTASSPAFPAQSVPITPKQAPTHVTSKPTTAQADVLMADDDLGFGLYRWDLNAPKDIDVDELDVLLESY